MFVTDLHRMLRWERASSQAEPDAELPLLGKTDQVDLHLKDPFDMMGPELFQL